MAKFKTSALPLLALALVSCSETSVPFSSSSSLSSGGEGSSSSSSVFVAPECDDSSLKGMLKYLSEGRNYTIAFTYGGTYQYSIYATEDTYGIYHNENEDKANMVHSDGIGLYKVNLNEGEAITGEYLKDADGVPYTSIYDQSAINTVYGFGAKAISQIDDGAEDYVFTDKTYKIGLIKGLGFEESDYAKVDTITAVYDSQTLEIVVSFKNKTRTYNFLVYDLGVTECPIEDIPEVYVPNDDLSQFREAFSYDNCTRAIYDDTDTEQIGIEIYHPHYYVSETYGQEANTIYIGLKDLSGCYTGFVYGSFDEGYSNVRLKTTKLREDDDVASLMHYPSKLLLMNSLQYLTPTEDSLHDEVGRLDEGHLYYTTNQDLIYDFADNFSISQSFDVSVYVPVRLEMEIVPSEVGDVAECSIQFIYYVTVGGTVDYYLSFIYSDFGVVSDPILDSILKAYDTSSD